MAFISWSASQTLFSPEEVMVVLGSQANYWEICVFGFLEPVTHCDDASTVEQL